MTSVQVGELNAPLAPLVAKLMVPDGWLPAVTVAVQVLGRPTATEAGEHPTVVVLTTVAVIAVELRLEALVASPE
jgi:hypothetical protein